MTQDNDIRRIFAKGFELFKCFGIKAVTMDQISQACGISKKTLYKYVSNKEDFLEKSFGLFADQMEMGIRRALSERGGNAVDQLFAMEKFAEEQMRGEENKLLLQLEVYYPKVELMLNSKREEIIFGMTKRNLEQGIEEGLYREDIHVDHITLLYYGHILAVHETIIADTQIDLNELRHTSLLYHIRGIASAKGLDYLNQLIQTEQ